MCAAVVAVKAPVLLAAIVGLALLPAAAGGAAHAMHDDGGSATVPFGLPSEPPWLDPSEPPWLDPSEPPWLDPSEPPWLDPSEPPWLGVPPPPESFVVAPRTGPFVPAAQLMADSAEPAAPGSEGPAGMLAVTDGSNYRIQLFHANGTFAKEFGSYGTGDGQFTDSMYAAWSPSGDRIAVADYGNHRIQIFYPNGTLAIKFGFISTTEPKGLYQPYYAAYSPQGDRIAVLDGGSFQSRVKVFNPNDGELVLMLDLPVPVDEEEGLRGRRLVPLGRQDRRGRPPQQARPHIQRRRRVHRRSWIVWRRRRGV